jgi:GTP cyclohydrolase I
MRAISAFLTAIDAEPKGELADTPRLVTEAWCDDLLSGRDEDPARLLADGSIACDDPGGVVALRQLAVSTMCPHHLLPAHGHADVVYVPAARVAGFGAIARCLRAVTRRLVLQEPAGARMARLLVDELGARSAACRLRLAHTCLIVRGASETGAVVETMAFEGVCRDGGADRELILGALGS